MKGDFHVRFCERLAGGNPACLLGRERGCMPADSFVRIWKFIGKQSKTVDVLFQRSHLV